MRLGWRNARPNDFQTPDQRPLRDQFGDLQKFMTWPHFRAEVDDGQAVGAGFALRTITAIDDPYQLIRANDTIQVPRDFTSWMFFGLVNVLTSGAGAGLYQAGFLLNAAVVNAMVADYTHGAGGPWRADLYCMYPVSAGQTLTVATSAPAAGTITAGFLSEAIGMFLPLV